MKRSLLACLALVLFVSAASAQVSSSFTLGVRTRGATLPASCTDNRRLYILTTLDGSNVPGVYRCNGTTYVVLGPGNVTGAASSTDNAIVRFDGTGGKTLQNSAATIDDNGSVNIPTGQTYKINNVALAKGDVGLGNVDNTSDANKPVSTAQQTALNLKANLASPIFTGTVTTSLLNVSGISIGAAAATTGEFRVGTTTTGVDIQNGTINLGSLANFGWSSGDVYGAAKDTNISRSAAGVVAFGTGAQGSTAGSWTATNGTLSGTLNGVTINNNAWTAYTPTAKRKAAAAVGSVASTVPAHVPTSDKRMSIEKATVFPVIVLCRPVATTVVVSGTYEIP